MENNIELKRVNGEIIKAELISYFELINVSKKYVFYTLNETVDNGLIKMYVSEVSKDGNSLTQQMTDDEWATLKSIMKSMLTGNENPNIKYLSGENDNTIQNTTKVIALTKEQIDGLKNAYSKNATKVEENVLNMESAPVIDAPVTEAVSQVETPATESPIQEVVTPFEENAVTPEEKSSTQLEEPKTEEVPVVEPIVNNNDLDKMARIAELLSKRAENDTEILIRSVSNQNIDDELKELINAEKAKTDPELINNNSQEQVASNTPVTEPQNANDLSQSENIFDQPMQM